MERKDNTAIMNLWRKYRRKEIDLAELTRECAKLSTGCEEVVDKVEPFSEDNPFL